MAIFQKKPLNWFITGNDTLSLAWQFATAGNLGRVNHHWTISNLPKGGSQAVGFVDMGLDAPTALARNKDRLTLTYDVRRDTTYTLSMKGVEYVDAPLNKDISLVSVGPTGFTTDGSLVRIKTGVGNQTLAYESAMRDSVLFMGAGRDAVQLDDNPLTGGTQYWALIRRGLGQVDAYNLQTGNFVRMEGGTTTFGNTNRYINYGEIEEIYATHARSGARYKFDPGRDIPRDPWGIGNRSLFDNIDLASDDLNGDQAVDAYSDSFNLAYFNFIRYTTNNLYVGEATVHSGNNVSGAYSTPGSQSRNGTHDLIVAEQASAIDGDLRLYVRNVQSGLYNEFNPVFLGSAADDGKDYAGVTGTTPASRVALYGFGGEDVLKGGAGNDYLFGGSSSYSQLVDGATGNQVWGRDGADFFGVGNTNAQGQLVGSGTDVIWDWHAGVDSLRVLANGTAIVAGLYGQPNLSSHDLIDLRAYAGLATSDADNDGSVLNEANDLTVINDGLIVALGRDGYDTLRDSPGNDRLYGNAQDNLIDLRAGGADRVLYDAYSGRQFVGGFDSNDASAGHDLFMVNIRVVDAFGDHRPLAMEARNSTGVYTNAIGYNPGVNYLHDVFYNPRLTATNAQHASSDGFWSPATGGGSDRTTFAIGVGFYVTAVAVQAIPFVGPILSAVFFSQALLMGAASASAPVPGFTTQPHQNATYSGTVDSYLTVLNNPTRPDTTAATASHRQENVPAFLSFFGITDAGDGYVPVLEFTRYSGLSGSASGIYGYFAVHSDEETLVYLVTSRDSLVDNSEAKLVAEINGELWADDFQVYDGQIDIYNAREEAPITLSLPTITRVEDSDEQLVASESTTTGSTPFTVTVNVDTAVSAGSTARLYDGTVAVGPAVSVSGLSFSLTDARLLGTQVKLASATAPDFSQDDTLTLTDDRVNYTVELIDGVTGIVTRNENDYFFTVSGGNAVVDGGAGDDILMLTETSAFLNSLSDERLVNIETITLAGEAGMDLDLWLQNEGFTVYGTGDLDNIWGSQGDDVIHGLGGEDRLRGGEGNDVFAFGSSSQLAEVGLLDGGSINPWTDQIWITAADAAIDDTDFVAVSGVEELRLTGASSITSMDFRAQNAGIQRVITGDSDTSITATMTALTVDAAAMVDNETLTLAGSTNFTVTGLNADVSAPTASGNLSLSYASTSNLVAQVTAGTENLTVIGGHSSQSITIEADAMDDNQSGTTGQSELTLGGSGAVVVNDFGSNLSLQSTASLTSLAVDVREVSTGSLVFSLGTGSVGGNVSINLSDLDAADEATITGGSNIGGSLTITTDGADVFAGGAVKGLTINGAAATTGVVLEGGSGNDGIVGGTGDDVLEGGVGADSLDGGQGDDTYVYNTGDVPVGERAFFSGGGVDTFRVDSSTTFVQLNGGNTQLTGLDVVNITASGASATFTAAQLSGLTAAVNGVSGGLREDLIVVGTTDADTIDLRGLTLTDASLQLDAGNGNDSISWDSSVGPVTISGGAGNDVIDEAGATDGLRDTLDGGDGNDVIYAGDGNDFLIGGTGADRLQGEQGADLFIFGSGHSTGYRWDLQDNLFNDGVPTNITAFVPGNNFDGAFDLITDFNPGDGDRIQLPSHVTIAGGDDVVDARQYEIFYGRFAAPGSDGLFFLTESWAATHTVIAYDDSLDNDAIGIVVLTGVFIESGWSPEGGGIVGFGPPP